MWRGMFVCLYLGNIRGNMRTCLVDTVECQTFMQDLLTS